MWGDTVPKISVIVPVYNSAAFLRPCVDSILAQTFSDLEILLIDDGSSDESPALCDAYAAQDPRVISVHQTNSGAAAARNHGLELATGTYIAFVDSDDYIDPDMYEKMMSINAEYNCDLVICDCFKEYVTGRELYTHELPSGYYDRERMKREYFPQLLMTKSVEYPVTISNWLLLIRREVIERQKIRYPEGIRFSEDLLFGAEVGYAANSLYYLKGYAPYHYRQNPASVTHTAYRDKWPMLLDLHRRITKAFGEKNDFDFQPQIDLCLLFFVYLAIGNLGSSSAPLKAKVHQISSLLSSSLVRQTLKRISIRQLEISWKLKMITYAYRWNQPFLIMLIQWYTNKKQQ